ncbi:MAG: adenosylcobalamin-dependent ribonucleoside-diphosphate reductase [Gammaproteobacteria bacterium]|nr:adenosylcobalamin-dependent ribonucleoside-diphosphate reductase [Gammaproteobacteria bacterium]
MSIFQEDISEKTWDVKYRYRLRDQIIDQSIEDTWRRVASAVAKAEALENRAKWEQAFFDILSGFRFLPGGRILAGAGTDHEVTLFNCFVMSVSEDTLPAVFDALREAAITLQYGGGVGYDFSILRPRGYPVTHTGTIASGPVSFMRIWDAMCATMESTGARRGAMMGILRCDHPDIEAFIAAKSDPHELRHFNLSVLVTDAFMQAVKEDREWELVFPVGENDSTDTMLRHWSCSAEPVACRVVKRVRAKELWDKIIRAAYDYAEPGVLFEDSINRLNNLWYREWISATNPCGEIPLPLYGSCNLGSLNLTQFVKRPYSTEADLDWDALQKTTIIATRFLDNVIDITHYPLMVQKQEERLTRRMGLGITGLADMLVMLGLPYGSEQSFAFTERLIKAITETTWQASIELARERGVFAAFHAAKYIQGHFVERLPDTIRQGIEKHGIRNSHHNTIAPTGTTSLLANNVSSGIEPIFHGQYTRRMRTAGDEYIKYSVTNYALRVWQQQDHAEPFPPAWQDVGTLTPEQHLKMQATLQPYIDNSISKTINVPVDFPFEKLISVYTDAWKMNLKGCTVFRLNPITGSVLSEDEVEHCGHCT